MKAIALLLALLLAGVALAGCTEPDDEPGTDVTPTPTTVDTPTPTDPTPTSPASPTPPTTPLDNATDLPSIAAVHVLTAPERVAAGEAAEVCWRVMGTGSVGHTAVHFDTESHHGEDAVFSAYDQGAVYPDNSAPTVAGTFQLPGVFCAQLTLNETTYLVAHAMTGPAGVPGTLSTEHVIQVGEAEGIAIAGDLSEVVFAGGNATVCWQVNGATGTSGHTAIHFDTESHPGATGADFALYDEGAIYPDNSAPTTSGSFALPGPFCANLTMPDSGVVYLRAHAILNESGTATHVLGDEHAIAVAPIVSIEGGAPARAEAGSSVQLCWRVEGTGNVGHTAIHFDTESHPDATGADFALYDEGAIYPDNSAPTTSGSFALPGPFCADLPVPETGTVYLRAHAILPGGVHDLSDEVAIAVE